MPDITFILPHWIYWGGLAAVPVLFFVLSRRTAPARRAAGPSARLAWLLWAAGGFMGIHRLYLKSWGAAIFIALFVGVIFCNHQAGQARNAHSIARNESFNAGYDLKQAEDAGEDAAAVTLLRESLEQRQKAEAEMEARLGDWRQAAGIISLAVLCLLVLDALLMRRLVRQARSRRLNESSHPPSLHEDVSPSDPRDGKFGRTISALNAFAGEFASYWTVIAVFVFYYEVIARYIFNSPTIWAHESMFLMFGMQYMLAGGFCLREGAHVRVDVLYMHLSARARAWADVVTSAFFFIFAGALLVTGWIFFHDSYSIGQVSHTEWEIPYWPIKFALPLGGALILLQGLAHLLRDIASLRHPDASHGH